MQNTQAQTHCNQKEFQFQDLGPRKVVVDFSGGLLSSDGGTLLLRELDGVLGLSKKLASCLKKIIAAIRRRFGKKVVVIVRGDDPILDISGKRPHNLDRMGQPCLWGKETAVKVI